MPPDKPPLDTSQPLYVSIRDGALVPRFTLAGKVSGHIGATRGAPVEPDGEAPAGRAAAKFAALDRRPPWIFDPAAIVMIPAVEVEAHRKAYEHALANGDLVRRTARDYQAQQRAAEAASKAAKDNREAPAASPNGPAPASAGGVS